MLRQAANLLILESDEVLTTDTGQRDQHWRSVVQKSRSQEFSFGRGRFRFSTATCWRRARTSRAVSLRLRKKTRMATKKERMISSTKHPFNTPQGSFAGPTLRNRKLLISSDHRLLSTDNACGRC